VSSTDTTPGTSHSVVVTGLTPGTHYFFQASSTATGLTPGTATTDATTLKVIKAVSPLTVKDISGTGASIIFETDIPTTAKVTFGTDQNNLNQSIDLTNAQTSQGAALTNLLNGTQYFVRVISSAPGAEDLTQTTNFTTTGALKVNDLTIENVTGDAAKVTVTTTQPSTITLKYGTPDLTTNPQTLTDDTVGTTHVFNLTGLTVGAAYQAQATATVDPTTSAQSNVATFSTLQSIQLTSGPSVTPASDTASITFTTDVSTTGQVRYGTTAALGSVSTITQDASTHTVQLTGLQPNTTYFYQIALESNGREPLTTATGQFTTQASIAKGDVDGDGKITIQDVTLTLQQVIGIITLSPAQIAAADVVPQGPNEPPLDLRDVTRLLRANAGIEPL
jgi:hypothetical protein